jgi:hypothetical protein
MTPKATAYPIDCQVGTEFHNGGQPDKARSRPDYKRDRKSYEYAVDRRVPRDRTQGLTHGLGLQHAPSRQGRKIAEKMCDE